MDNPCASADEDFITEGGCTIDYGVADVVVGHNNVGRSLNFHGPVPANLIIGAILFVAAHRGESSRACFGFSKAAALLLVG